MEYPKCKLCERGELVPVNNQAVSGWVCTNPSCGFYILLVEKRVKIGKASLPEQPDEDTGKES